MFNQDTKVSSFIPKKGDKPGRPGVEYQSTKIIEEESVDSSHQSYGGKIIADRKNKFPSVEIDPNKGKMLHEDKSSGFIKEDSNLSKKQSGNTDQKIKNTSPDNHKLAKTIKSSDPTCMKNLKQSIASNKLLNRSQSPRSGESDEGLEFYGSDKQDNYFVNPPELKQKSTHQGAIH